jgi:putative transposase
MDLFCVPTASFRLLYGFFVIHHGRRLVLHFNTTFHPTAAWVIQQLREAFPFDSAPRHLILDNDSIFNGAVVHVIRSMSIDPVRTAYRSPWQDPVAERWIGTLRRELLDNVIVRGEQHLRRLGLAYVAYYNRDRGHGTLGGDSPAGRPVQPRPAVRASVVTLPRVGGLHHRYEWREAA